MRSKLVSEIVLCGKLCEQRKYGEGRGVIGDGCSLTVKGNLPVESSLRDEEDKRVNVCTQSLLTSFPSPKRGLMTRRNSKD